MSESLLKKEFDKSTVQRCRNLVTGNFGNATKIQVGYEKSSEEHAEGDIWEENGKQWTIKNGLKQSVRKLDRAVDLCRMPLTCPHCGKPMKGSLDKRMYTLLGICSLCVARMEDDLKRAGMYRAVEKQVMLSNVNTFVQELEDRIVAATSDTDTKIATEDGLVEDWGRLNMDLVKSLEEWKELLMEKLT